METPLFALKKCAETACMFRKEVQDVQMNNLELKENLMSSLYKLMVTLTQLRLAFTYSTLGEDDDTDYLATSVRSQITNVLKLVRQTRWKNSRVSEVESTFYNMKRYLA